MVTLEEFSYTMSLKAISIVVNLALTLIFVFLRIRGTKEPLTQSQRWVTTIITWVFFLNTLTLISEVPSSIVSWNLDYTSMYYLQRIRRDLDLLIGICLILIGFVYPRPYTNWNRLTSIIYTIMFIALILVVMQLVGSLSGQEWAYTVFQASGWTYLLGWYLPVLIWIPHYEKEQSPQMRMVMTLFIWGLMGISYNNLTWNLFQLLYGTLDFKLSTLLGFTLYFYVVAQYIRILYKMRGRWAQPEIFTIGYMVFFFIISFLKFLTNTAFSMDYSLDMLTYISGHMPWAILRPAFFSYAILRYQIFGPRLKVETPVRWLMASVSGLAVFTIAQKMPLGQSTEATIAIAGVLGLLVFFPALIFSKRLVARFLPMASQEEQVSIQERRDNYLVSLQTAVVKGHIDLESDAEVLAKQRVILGISEREHELLMDSYSAREREVTGEAEVHELFLIKTDGRPMVHIRTKLADKASPHPEKDKDIMAGMLIAIHDYVQEGLKGGTSGRTSLDTIKYGDYSLLIETEERLVLALVVRGPDDPHLRQGMRDQLTLLKKRYGDILIKWDGDMDRTAGAEKDLNAFIEGLLKPS